MLTANAHCELLFRIRPDLAADKVENSEAPDFFLHYAAGRKVGLEVTELYQSASNDGYLPQEQESLRHRVVCEAQKMFEAQDPETAPLHVSVHFSSAHPLAKKGTKELAKAVADSVRRNALPSEGSCILTDDIPEEVYALNIYRTEGTPRTAWTVPGGQYVPILESADLIEVIQKKSKLLAAYRQRCDEVWLLIVADGFRLGTMFQIEAQRLAPVPRGEFNRVFLLHDQRRIYEMDDRGQP